MFEQSAAGMALTDSQGRFTRVNDRYCEMTGRSREELLQLRMQDITHPDDLPPNMVLFHQSLETGASFEIEKRYLRPDGSTVWVHNSVTTIRDDDANLLNTLAVSIDISERKRFERHLQLVIAELNHRVKNTLAIVQSLARQSFTLDRATHETIAAFESRLRALATAHDLLTSNGWEAACLKQLIEITLQPFCPDRCRLSGPEAIASPRVAISLALALHELAANAEKHGALSNAAGALSITWDVSPDGQFDLRWVESGGPPVEQPTRTGFGTRLLTRSLHAERDGSVELQFRREGVECRIRTRLGETASI